MKRILFSLFWFLLLCNCVQAQKPQFTIHAGIGEWRGIVQYGDPYASDFRRWQTYATLGVGGDFRLVDHVFFAPEIGVELYDHNYFYYNTRKQKEATVDLTLFYTRISPGFKLRLLEHLDVRLGLNVLIASGAIGNYRLDWIDQELHEYVHVTYKDRLSQIRTGGSLGPEVNVGYAFIFKNGGRISPRASAYLACTPMFRSTLDTPYNPEASARLSFEICYTFGCKTRSANP